jgi:hypothetical protein
MDRVRPGTDAELARASLARRLWAKVDRDGPLILSEVCWVFTGYVCKQTGYGKIANRPGPPIGAHVAAYLVNYGSMPDGLQVLHACDNRRCVRPEHLRAGTQKENMRECVERQRQVPSYCQGQDVGNASLTNDHVRSVKAALAAGERGRSLARRFGVSEQVISAIKTGRSWRGVA